MFVSFYFSVSLSFLSFLSFQCFLSFLSFLSFCISLRLKSLKIVTPPQARIVRGFVQHNFVSLLFVSVILCFCICVSVSLFLMFCQIKVVKRIVTHSQARIVRGFVPHDLVSLLYLSVSLFILSFCLSVF
jgi:hypothetical protein